jgi:hypothetical protein
MLPDWRYLLSYILPVPMRSTYRVIDEAHVQKNALGTVWLEDIVSHSERARWWQWRDLIFRHRVEVLT